jgi:hypothetical protein
MGPNRRADIAFLLARDDEYILLVDVTTISPLVKNLQKNPYVPGSLADVAVKGKLEKYLKHFDTISSFEPVYGSSPLRQTESSLGKQRNFASSWHRWQKPRASSKQYTNACLLLSRIVLRFKSTLPFRAIQQPKGTVIVIQQLLNSLNSSFSLSPLFLLSACVCGPFESVFK